jgi:hypothetical protein
MERRARHDYPQDPHRGGGFVRSQRGRDSFLPAAIRELAHELHASSLAVSGRANWVTRESPCPVLVVHAGDEEQMVL